MSETSSSYSESPSYSYSYSYTNSSSSANESDEKNEMWSQIQRMPLLQLEKTENFAYIQKVMDLVNRYEFVLDDPHMSDKKYTMKIAHLLKLISFQSSSELKKKDLKIGEIEKRKLNDEDTMKAKLEVQHAEILRLRDFEEKALLTKAPETKEDHSLIVELRRLKEENDNLAIELRKISRENEELRQFTQIRKDDRDEVNEYNSKILLEFKHLVAKHNRLLDKSKHTEDMLQELRAREEARCLSEESELARLREKVDSLQQENANLVHSRDRAEELCEHREAQALRDMAELRQVTKKMIQAETEKFDHLKAEFTNYKIENDAHIEEIIIQHEQELEEKEEEIKALRIQVGKTQRIFDDDSDTTVSVVSKGGSDVLKNTTGISATQHRLQRENYDLSQEIEQLEIRLDAAHEENSRLARIVKDYESGNEGLRNLRHTLADSNRTNELLQNENTQLRERLHALEDSLTFTAALQELCRRIGVTDEEINSLKPSGTQAYSEMDTLKDELNILREEVEWLEKDRRHWMNKVRLQPLMDTKLRFELGLTSEQLKQLDQLVEQMKAGKLVLEDESTDYKEKYYKELQLRRKDASQFNDYVKGRIDNALQIALAGVKKGEVAQENLTTLREQLHIITSATPAPQDAEHERTIKQLQEQLDSYSRRLAQSELSMKAENQELARLNEEIKVARSEKNVIADECERYRNLVFSYIANEGNTEGTARGSSEKWAEIASALRDQVTLKDDLIATLLKKVDRLQQTIEQKTEEGERFQREITVLSRTQDNLNDQLAALRESHEEILEQNAQLTKINKDVLTGLEVERNENSSSRELLQKIVTLRKREGVLIQRLRRTTAEKEELLASEHNLRHSMGSTLKSLQDILQGTSNGVVLAPSATTHNAEQDVLATLHDAVENLTRGKLYREDSAYLAKLYNIYCSLDNREELTELQAKAKKQQEEIETLTGKLDEMTLELHAAQARIPALEKTGNMADKKPEDSVDYYKAASSKWEAEAGLWKQKHLLAAKRLEVKEQEVKMLESDVTATKEEVLKVKEHIQNIFSQAAVKTDTFQCPTSASEKEKRSEENIEERKQEPALSHDAVIVHRLEKEVARLKSINFSLLQHSLDMQSTNKSLEVTLEGKQQEISLIRSAGDANVVSNFISAAIQEHTSLRRQNELALIQAKKLKMKLTVTEANLQVVANEASSYKLGAYRLYRKYVDEVVKVVDYLRSIQRASEGALSPHRTEILDKRYARVLRELEEAVQKNANLSSTCTELNSMVKTLEQQLNLVKEGLTDEAMEKVDRSLREAHSKVRESTHQLMEAQADAAHAIAKVARMDEHIKHLNDELTRLEFGCLGTSPLDEAMLRNLLQLKETVFSAAQAPPLALTLAAPGDSNASRSTKTKEAGDADLLVEYKKVVAKQLELVKEGKELREALEKAHTTHAQAEKEKEELKETVKRLEDHVAYSERQLEDTRRTAETREARISKAHETQSSLAIRAAEHTIKCLQELLQKKDATIQQLQGQIQTERQKICEFQSKEASRIEKLHEELIGENNALVRRFEEAIKNGTGEEVEHPVPIGAEGGSTAALAERVRSLTAQVITLKHELHVTRDLNISLETQVESLLKQIAVASARPPAPIGTGANGAAGTNPTSLAAPTTSDPTTTAAAPAPTPSAGAPASAPSEDVGAPVTASTDALSSIIRNQQSLLDSIRLREVGLMQELSVERQKREGLEREIEHLRLQAIERGATTTVVMQHNSAHPPQQALAGRSPIEEELRAQISRMEQDLMKVRQELAHEQRNCEQQRLDAEKWKEHLNSVNAETEKQREELEKARQMASMSGELQSTVDQIRSQNEKLILAASILKQRLMEEAQRGGTTDRKLQQEIALAQRLAVIQEESTKQVKHLDFKMKAMQKELDDKVTKEQQALKQSEESQRAVIQLQQQLRDKEKSIASLQLEVQQLQANMEQERKSSGQRRSGSPSRKKQASPSRDIPVLGSEVLLQPQIASLMSKELHKMQRDNLQEISTLRAAQRRLESDLEEARLQVRSEREGSRAARTQCQQIKKEKEEMEEKLSKEIVRLHREGRRDPQGGRTSSAGTLTASSSAKPSAATPGTTETNEKLQMRIKELELQLEKANASTKPGTNAPTGGNGDGAAGAGAAAATPATTSTPPPASSSVKAHTNAAPTNLNKYMASIQSLESVIDSLQRKISVDAETKVNTLEHKFTLQRRTIQLLATELSTVKNVPLATIQETYDLTETFEHRPPTLNNLEAQLLEQKNKAVTLQFECDNLRVQVRRLQQHFQELLEDRGLPNNLVPASELTVLHALIENLKIVVESLRKENAALRSRSPAMSTYDHAMDELQGARRREAELQHQLQDATTLLVNSRVRGPMPADVLMQQRSLSAREVEQMFQRSDGEFFSTALRSTSSLPPPLPPNPNPPHGLRRSTNTVRSASSTGTSSSSQRRLSTADR